MSKKRLNIKEVIKKNIELRHERFFIGGVKNKIKIIPVDINIQKFNSKYNIFYRVIQFNA